MPYVTCIHSIDSERLLRLVNTEAERIVMPILIVSHGAPSDDSRTSTSLSYIFFMSLKSAAILSLSSTLLAMPMMETKNNSNGRLIAIIAMFFLFAMISFVTNLAAPIGTIWGNEFEGNSVLGEHAHTETAYECAEQIYYEVPTDCKFANNGHSVFVDGGLHREHWRLCADDA